MRFTGEMLGFAFVPGVSCRLSFPCAICVVIAPLDCIALVYSGYSP